MVEYRLPFIALINRGQLKELKCNSVWETLITNVLREGAPVMRTSFAQHSINMTHINCNLKMQLITLEIPSSNCDLTPTVWESLRKWLETKYCAINILVVAWGPERPNIWAPPSKGAIVWASHVVPPTDYTSASALNHAVVALLSNPATGVNNMM